MARHLSGINTRHFDSKIKDHFHFRNYAAEKTQIASHHWLSHRCGPLANGLQLDGCAEALTAGKKPHSPVNFLIMNNAIMVPKVRGRTDVA
jgi:agmatine/peptidylarginine deiminase